MQSLCKVCSVDFCRVEKIAANLTPIPKVVDTNPMSLNDVLRDVCRVADALGQTQAGKRASKALQARIDAAVGLAAQCTRGGVTAPKKVAFLEWTDPIFVGGHWTPQLIEMAGGLHPLNPCSGPGHGAGNSHTVTHDEFIASDPDIIIVAPCGLDLAATKRELAPLAAQPWWATMRAVTSRSVHVVDGNQMFNRPGPRLVEALEWLVSILHDVPDMKPKDFPAELL
jgi:iron complex transport system substrate-binding protein